MSTTTYGPVVLLPLSILSVSLFEKALDNENIPKSVNKPFTVLENLEVMGLILFQKSQFAMYAFKCTMLLCSLLMKTERKPK